MSLNIIAGEEFNGGQHNLICCLAGSVANLAAMYYAVLVQGPAMYYALLTSRRLYQTWRGYNYGPTGENVLYTLIGVNSAVFAAWQVADPSFMRRHFTLSRANLQEGRVHTAVTYAFSHFSFLHLGTNLLVLFFFGRSLTRVMSGRKLMNLYMSGALCSAGAHLVWDHVENRRHKHNWFGVKGNAALLGASGSVSAIVTLFCCLFPREMIYVNFIIPVPAFLLGILYVLHDLHSIRSQDNVSHAGHLGGVLTGLAYFLRMRYRY